MAVKNFEYSCKGTLVEHKKIQCKVDDQSSVISELVIYESPRDPKTGEHLKSTKTAVKNESQIRGHIDGIKLKLKKELGIINPTFKY